MAAQRQVPTAGVLVLLVAAALAAGGGMWATSLQQLDRTIARKRAALKPLQLMGRIPPNREVHAYLLERTKTLEATYRAALARAASVTEPLDGRSNPQLFFQERVHNVQGTLERLAGARTMEPPEQLGFPKELPPPDVVPRLLVQLQLVEDAAEMIIAQGNARLLSVKLEDPELLPPPAEEQPTFLMRLPAQFHFTCSLTALTKILGMVERAKPFIDLQGLSTRALPPAEEEAPAGKENAAAASRAPAPVLDVELLLARYLITMPELPGSDAAEADKGARPEKKAPASRKKSQAEEE